MINAYVPKEAFVKYIVVAIKFYVNHHFMDAIVSKGIVLPIIVLVLIMGENAILKDVKIATFKNSKKFVAKI